MSFVTLSSELQSILGLELFSQLEHNFYVNGFCFFNYQMLNIGRDYMLDTSYNYMPHILVSGQTSIPRLL